MESDSKYSILKVEKFLLGHPFIIISSRKVLPEFRFAPSTLRNSVPSGATHEAAAGHALAESSDYYRSGSFRILSNKEDVHFQRRRHRGTE